MRNKEKYNYAPPPIKYCTKSLNNQIKYQDYAPTSTAASISYFTRC